MEKGLIHIYCGDGKGKTTAALGLAIRCAGGGGKVLFYQFLKDGTSSEINILKEIKNIDVIEGYKKTKFYNQMTDAEKKEAAEYYNNKFDEIVLAVKSNNYDLLILDEFTYAINFNYITVEKFIDFIKTKPQGLEIALTGRNPCDAICNCADYISEVIKIKHPYDKGITARRLIEW